MRNHRNILLYGDGEVYCVCLDLMVNSKYGSLICYRKGTGIALLLEFTNGEFVVAHSDSEFGGKDLYELRVRGADFKNVKKHSFKFPMWSFKNAVKTLINACLNDDEKFYKIESALSRLAFSPFGFKVKDEVLLNIRSIAQSNGFNVRYKSGKVYVCRSVSKSHGKLCRATPLSISCLAVNVMDNSGVFTYQGLEITY